MTDDQTMDVGVDPPRRIAGGIGGAGGGGYGKEAAGPHVAGAAAGAPAPGDAGRLAVIAAVNWLAVAPIGDIMAIGKLHRGEARETQHLARRLLDISRIAAVRVAS